MRILISGGGIGGLTAALALLKRGFDVEVYEQAGELKEVGAGLQLSANGNRVLYELGLGEALQRLSCEAKAKQIRLWNTGDTWKLFDLGAVSVERYGFPYFTVYRPDLLTVLAAAVRALKPDAIHLKSRSTGFEQNASGVTLLLDVPRLDQGVKVFDQMIDAGKQLAGCLRGTLVDDNRIPVTEAGLEQIRGQLRQIYNAMEARGIRAERCPAGDSQLRSASSIAGRSQPFKRDSRVCSMRGCPATQVSAGTETSLEKGSRCKTR